MKFLFAVLFVSFATAHLLQPKAGNGTVCSVCLTVAGAVESHLSTVKELLDAVCSKLTNTAEKLACEAAVAALVKLLESDSAQKLCTTLHLCPGTEGMLKTFAWHAAILPIMSLGPKFDACTYCEEAMGYAIQNKAEVQKAFDTACGLIPAEFQQVCQQVSTAVMNMLNKDSAQQICTTLKVCKSGKSLLGGGVECTICKLAWKELQNEAPKLETALEADCNKITNSTIIHTVCDKAVEKGIQFIQNTNGQSACSEFGMCNSTRILA